MRPPGSPEALERRRRRAIGLLDKGFSPVQVADKVGVDRRSVRRWKVAYRDEGEAGLSARAAPGRPPKLAPEAKAQLEDCLVQGPQAFGFSSDLWTCPRVAELVDRKFGVRYHVDHVGRLLRSMGWSPQKPERRARERDEQAIRGWIKEAWPRVKKKRAG